jgi:hypothetical protein
MKIDFVRVFGFEPSLHGMRNPMNSWADSDSMFYDIGGDPGLDTEFGFIKTPEAPVIGPKDLELACKLIRRGNEHCKFMRQIMIWVRFTVPRYVWQELDTYKVATTRNSCSTMNKLGSVSLELEDFEDPIPESLLAHINDLGRFLREAKADKDKDVRRARVELKNDLPEGFLQSAMYTMSYQTALAMLLQRENHRLPQWRLTDHGSICQFLMSLPYMPQFYKAATFKRDQLREAAKALKSVISMADDGGLIAIDKSAIEDILAKVKRAA